MEIILTSIRSVQLTVNFKCFLSWKNLLFKMCTHCILFSQLLPFFPLLYIDFVFIFYCPLFSLPAHFVPLYLKKKTISANQSRGEGTIFESLKCDRTSGNWLIISSLLHSLICIRILNLVVSSFPSLLLMSCPNVCHSLPSRWVLFLLRQWLMIHGHTVPFLPLPKHRQSLTIA